MKKIHRFLVSTPMTPSLSGVTVTDPEIIHLMKNVLKLSLGEQCIVFAHHSDDYLCTITTLSKKEVTLTVTSVIPKKVVSKNITACVSITKRDSYELIVQKLTELGISRIIPIVSERTIKQSLRIDRLQKISDEALEQSGGSTRVVIDEPMSLEQSLQETSGTAQHMFDMDGAPLSSSRDQFAAFFIGPEGGWSDGDLALFADRGVKTSTLGGTTLRAETAAIVAAYTLLWH